MSNQTTSNEGEVLLRDEDGNSKISVIASATNVLNTMNHDGTAGINEGIHEGNVAATTTAAVTATTTPTTKAPFHLPDGRLMDSKNTLQSFDVAAATQQQQQQQNLGATIAPSTMKPPVPVLPLENNLQANNNVDNTNCNINNNNNNNEDTNPPSDDNDENVIRAQAVPVQSLVVADGQIFHPSDNMTPAATTPTETTTNPTGGRKSTAFWIVTSVAIISAMTLRGVVAGVGVYCGTGNCGGGGGSSSSTNTSPSTSLNDNGPASSPTMFSHSPVSVITSTSSTTTTTPVLPPSTPTSPPIRVTTVVPATSPIATETPPTRNPTIDPVALTNVPTTFPVLRPPTNSTTTRPINEQLRVACNFFSYTYLTACQRATYFIDAATRNTIPTEIGLLTQLTWLSLFNNQLTGTIPSTLGNLTQLTYFSLEQNQFNGTIPSTLGNLTRLGWLDLSDNQLTGTIPTLGHLMQLTSLDLSMNRLTGTIPSTLGNLTQLDGLSLYNNTQLSGTIPSILCSVVVCCCDIY